MVETVQQITLHNIMATTIFPDHIVQENSQTHFIISEILISVWNLYFLVWLTMFDRTKQEQRQQSR